MSFAAGAIERAALAIEAAWRRGEVPNLDAYWNGLGRNPEALPILVKADLRGRFTIGQRPEVSEYLERFPFLRDWRDRVVSLVYEEYCLREDRGEAPDDDQFCQHYEPWRDSLESQLRVHRLLSQAAGVKPRRPRFPELGGRFVHFRLDAILGRGGEGQVYLAREEGLGDRLVALKITLDRGREPAVMGRLEHPRIVSILSRTLDEPTGLRGLCMPYRPARPLHEVIERAQPSARPASAQALWDAATPEAPHDPGDRPGWAGFPLRGTYAEGAAWVVMTLAHALAYAHARGVLHRDVKPANVLLTARDGPQLLDFNLAHDPQAAAEDALAARDGGTLPYMAPEQLDAFLDPTRHGDVREPADLYALGLVLVELLTGQRPEGPDPHLLLPRAIAELRDRRALGTSPAIRPTNPTVPHALEAIASRCLAPRPSDRYASAQELAEDLTLFLNRKTPRRAGNPSPRERLNNRLRRNRGMLVGSALAATLALGVGGRSAFLTPTEQKSPARTDRVASTLIREALEAEARGDPRAAHDAFSRADADRLALSAYRQAAEEHPHSASVQAGLGLALLRFPSFSEDAPKAFQKALTASEPGSGEGAILAHFGLGLRHESGGHFEEAEAQYDRGMQALRLLGDPIAADGIIQRVAEVHGVADGALRFQNRLGSARMIRRDLNRAREALSQTQRLEFSAGYYPLHQNLAGLACIESNYEEANREMTRAIEIAEVLRPDLSKSSLAGLHLGRADYRVHWAETLKDVRTATTENYRRSVGIYQDALEDFKAAQTLGGEQSGRAGESWSAISALKARAEDGLRDARQRLEALAAQPSRTDVPGPAH